MENYEIVAKILEYSGGKENIQSVNHCATRLRVMVYDKEKINQKSIEEVDKVKGVFYNSGQLQIIFGTGTVNKIYEEFMKFDINTQNKEDSKSELNQGGTAIQRAIRSFGDVFVPIIPVLVATGLFMGLRGLIMQEQVLALFGRDISDISDNFILFTQVLTDTAFIFLPALIAWSAFKVFGGSPIIGLILGLMLVSPSLPNAWDVASRSAEPIMFFGFIPIVGYQGSVLPAFISGLIGAKLEKRIRKVVPDALDLILTPFLTLLIMISLALLVIGPVFRSFEDIILNGTIFILGLPFGLSGLFIGFFHQMIIITGVHHIFNLLEIQLLENFGYNAFNPIISAATAAQGGAALAVGVKTKSKRLKALALPSSLSAFLGITEPAIFGVNLRYVKPFIMGLIGGAVGGFLASLFNLQATGMAITVIPGALLFLNEQLFIYILANVAAISVAFGLTWMFGYSDKMIEDK